MTKIGFILFYKSNQLKRNKLLVLFTENLENFLSECKAIAVIVINEWSIAIIEAMAIFLQGKKISKDHWLQLNYLSMIIMEGLYY